MGLLENKIAPTLQRITGEDPKAVSQDMTNKALYAALLALTGTALPADIVLPAVLTCSASAGTFEIITDGVLK